MSLKKNSRAMKYCTNGEKNEKQNTEPVWSFDSVAVCECRTTTTG
jgi:hypothetical protein